MRLGHEHIIERTVHLIRNVIASVSRTIKVIRHQALVVGLLFRMQYCINIIYYKFVTHKTITLLL